MLIAALLILLGIVVICVCTIVVPLDSTVNHMTRAIKQHMARTPRIAPMSEDGGNGVVIVAGGETYGELARNNIEALRYWSPGLPVEVFALNSEEMNARVMRELSARPDVTVHNLGVKKLGRDEGYANKVRAIMESRFTRVLLLDADNMPLQDVRPLFDLCTKSTGAIFWPDTVKMEQQRYHELWGVQYKAWSGLTKRVNSNLLKKFKLNLEFEQESGQIVVDKSVPGVLNALSMVAMLNREHKVAYQLYRGDKDLFQIGFALCEQPVMWCRHRLLLPGVMTENQEFQPHGFVQRHPRTGEPLFLHMADGNVKTQDAHKSITHVQYPTSWETRHVTSLSLQNRTNYYNSGEIKEWVVPMKP